MTLNKLLYLYTVKVKLFFIIHKLFTKNLELTWSINYITKVKSKFYFLFNFKDIIFKTFIMLLQTILKLIQ